MLRYQRFIHKKEVSIPVTREGPDFKLALKVVITSYTSVEFRPGCSCLKQHELCTKEIVYTDSVIFLDSFALFNCSTPEVP